VIAFTFFPSLRDAAGQRGAASWERLLERLSVPKIAAEKELAPGLAFATFREDRRALDRVELVHAIGLDFDDLEGPAAWDALVERFAKTASFAHTTWSASSERPRARVFLPLSRPVTAEEFRLVHAAVARVCEGAGLALDRRASDPSRFWFLPSVPVAGGFFLTARGVGRPVNVDRALEAERERASAVPPAPSSPPSSAPRATGADVEVRAAAYLARCEPAISGQGGHEHTFRIAQKLVRGFRLAPEKAFPLLAEWNLRCEPPWSERALRRKLDEAEKHGRLPEGELLERERRTG
jgi:hypothetical protein